MRRTLWAVPIVMAMLLVSARADEPKREGDRDDRPKADRPKTDSGVRIIINGREVTPGNGVVTIREGEDGERPRPERDREGAGRPQVGREGDGNPRILRWPHADKRTEPSGEKKFGFLGITPAPVGPVVAAQLGLEDGRGVVVEGVASDSPAKKAGIARYDIITRIDDQVIYSVEQLQKLIAARKPGSKVRVVFIHKGRESAETVTLGDSATQSWKQPISPDFRFEAWPSPESKIPGFGPGVPGRPGIQMLPGSGPLRMLLGQGRQTGPGSPGAETKQFQLFIRRPGQGEEKERCVGECRPECPHEFKQECPLSDYRPSPPELREQPRPLAENDLLRQLEPLRRQLPPEVFEQLRRALSEARERDEQTMREGREQAERGLREIERARREFEARARREAEQRLNQPNEQAQREAREKLERAIKELHEQIQKKQREKDEIVKQLFDEPSEQLLDRLEETDKQLRQARERMEQLSPGGR